MIVVLQTPFTTINKYALLYGCPEIFKNANNKESKGVPLGSVGCGASERKQEDVFSNGAMYSGKNRKIITVYGIYGENIGCSASYDRYTIYLFNRLPYLIFSSEIVNLLKIRIRLIKTV